MAVSERQYEAIIALAGRHKPAGQDAHAAGRELILRAYCLARRGRYEEAAAAMSELPADSPLRPTMLDLKAKVYAQQGRYLEAEACWREAIRLSPDTLAFHRGLSAIAEDRRYPFWLRIVVVAAVAGVSSGAACFVLIVILKLMGWLGK